MATVGRGAYADAAFAFFEGLRTFDAEAACAVVAEDADMQSPWNEGTVSGKEAIQAALTSAVSDPKSRPSFTIRDVSGDGNVCRLSVSMSGRFGEAPQVLDMALLHLKGAIHHIVIR